MAIVAAYDGDTVVAGVVGNRSARVVGLSNLFTTTAAPDQVWAGAVSAIPARFHGLPLVGYEHGPSLRAAHQAGFISVGPLRGWLKDEPCMGWIPSPPSKRDEASACAAACAADHLCRRVRRTFHTADGATFSPGGDEAPLGQIEHADPAVELFWPWGSRAAPKVSGSTLTYWLAIGPFSALIRRRWLRAIAARAQSV